MPSLTHLRDMSEADISTDSLEDCQDLKSGVSMADSSTAYAEESMQDEDDDENDENALVVVMTEAEEDTNDEDGDHSGEGKGQR
ncbi:hypothetical protein O3P69_001953 [Scylla paramamosain]|uniref:Uncharacterized protein n=1 Tax=Scylla paramamosain TaxID=85552 RepID=A0AAW0V4Q1_SCYPA